MPLTISNKITANAATARPFNDLSSSPGGSSSSVGQKGPHDKRDSKVIKAAQYWNNFIGDVNVMMFLQNI